MHELDISVGQAAKEFDTHSNMIWRMLSGHRAVRPCEVVTWSKLLEIPVTVALRHFGCDVPDPKCLVIGIVRGSGRVTLLPPDRQTRVEAPNDNAANLVALRVESAHAALSVFDGAHLYYEPSTTVRVDAFGHLAVVELGDHPSPLVGIVDRASIGKGRVTLFGGVDTFESEQMLSAAPIRWQRS